MAVLYLTEQGSVLHKEGEVLTIRKDGEILQRVPGSHIEQIVVMGNIQLTTQVIANCLLSGVECVYCSSRGRYYGRIVPPEANFGELRRAQVRASLDASRPVVLARCLLGGKLRNQATFLRRAARARGPLPPLQYAIDAIDGALRHAAKAKTVEALRGIEGAAGGAYYRAFGVLLRQHLGFSRRARRPPTDPVNSMLSLGYMLLAQDMESAIRRTGLDASVSFLHAVRQSRPSLVFDLMEEFRPIVVDSVVLRLVNTMSLGPDDFTGSEGEERGVRLTSSGLKTYLAAYEQRMQTSVYHRGRKQATTYRRVLELQARALAHSLLHDQEYRPFLVR